MNGKHIIQSAAVLVVIIVGIFFFFLASRLRSINTEGRSKAAVSVMYYFNTETSTCTVTPIGFTDVAECQTALLNYGSLTSGICYETLSACQTDAPLPTSAPSVMYYYNKLESQCKSSSPETFANIAACQTALINYGSLTSGICYLTIDSCREARMRSDLNFDGFIDIFDYNILVQNFELTGTPGFITADIDINGVVDIFDYNLLVTDFPQDSETPTSTPISTPTSTPITTPTSTPTGGTVCEVRTVNGYLDADGDMFGAGPFTVCADATGTYVDVNTDCYDSNNKVFPGSTTCSDTNRGDGSYDYDCSNTQTTCGTGAYQTATATTPGKKCFVNNTNPAGVCRTDATVIRYTFTGSVACGASGSVCSANANYSASCDVDSYDECVLSGTTSGCTSYTTGKQSCQ